MDDKLFANWLSQQKKEDSEKPGKDFFKVSKISTLKKKEMKEHELPDTVRSSEPFNLKSM
jgi:hypothetical protein